jgi:hypothetical protein
MDQTVRAKLREALLTVTALKTSMEHALQSDPNAVWRHAGYRDYMRKYNHVVAYVGQLTPVNAPIDTYDLDAVPHWGDTVMPQQKRLFESVHANLAILEAWLRARVDLPAEQAESLKNFFEANLRRAIFETPTHERDVQNAIEQLLIGRGLTKGIDYDREVGRVKVSTGRAGSWLLSGERQRGAPVTLNVRPHNPTNMRGIANLLRGPPGCSSHILNSEDST